VDVSGNAPPRHLADHRRGTRQRIGNPVRRSTPGRHQNSGIDCRHCHCRYDAAFRTIHDLFARIPTATAKSYAFRISIIALAVLTGQVLQAFLPHPAAVVVNDLSQLAACLSAAISCAYFASKSYSWERRRRVFAAIGMTGWTIGQFIWSWYQIVERTETPSPSWADAGYPSIARSRSPR
jgi:hypothetical protein